MIVGTEKVLRGSGVGPRERRAATAREAPTGGKVGRSWVRSDSGRKGLCCLIQNSKKLGCVFQKDTKLEGPKRSVQVSQGALRHRLQSMVPSQGVIQRSEPHERSPYALKFEDRSQEETLQQERCARRDAWKMAKHVQKLKENDKATFYALSRSLAVTSAIFDEIRGKREIVVDSGASSTC